MCPEMPASDKKYFTLREIRWSPWRIVNRSPGRQALTHNESPRGRTALHGSAAGIVFVDANVHRSHVIGAFKAWTSRLSASPPPDAARRNSKRLLTRVSSHPPE